MQHVEPGLQNENPNVRRAAFTAIAVSCEGCADHIRSKLVILGFLARHYEYVKITQRFRV